MPLTSKTKKTSGIVVPHKLKWHQQLVAVTIYTLMRTLAATWRMRWHDETGLLSGNFPERVIYCSWHNRLAVSMAIYKGIEKKTGTRREMAAIVSASKDGGIVARILELFRAQPVRGSSSRRGPQALLELTTWAERGLDIAITPDGPRGPCYKIQNGIISLAQVTGLPIIPAASHIHWKICVKSWDRFQIPLPFTRIDVTFAKPVRVLKEISDEQREAIRSALETKMNSITRD